MFMLGHTVKALAVILDSVLHVYSLVVLIAVLLQWVNPDPSNSIVRALRSLTEPVFAWVRARLPFSVTGMLDLSPMVVILVLWFLQLSLIPGLKELAFRLM